MKDATCEQNQQNKFNNISYVPLAFHYYTDKNWSKFLFKRKHLDGIHEEHCSLFISFFF